MTTESRYDVCVVGFGAWEAASAWALARRGLRVIALNEYAPPHEHGSHTGRTRLARRSAHEGAGYTPITQRAFTLWHELEDTYDVALLEATGALIVGEPDGRLVAPSRASLEDGDDRVVVATGDSGRGFRYAPAVGGLIADLTTGRAPVPNFLRAQRLTHV